VLEPFQSVSQPEAGWTFTDHLRTQLVVDAVDMALYVCRPNRGLAHHHLDQGTL